jgi:hypothetical protein
MRFCLAACALTFAVAAYSQTPETVKVSVSIPGARATVVVEQLSAASGVRLTADREMDADVAVLVVKDRPLKEAMDMLAEAVDGRWLKSGSGWKLLPSAAKRRKDIQTQISARTGEIGKSIQEMDGSSSGSFNPFGGRSPGEEDKQSANQVAQAQRAILTSVGPARLAAIGRGERVVFSTSPTRMQVGIRVPGNAIQALVAQNNAAAAKYDANALEDEIPPMFRNNEFMKEIMQRAMPKPPVEIKSAPAKLIVAAGRRSGIFAWMGMSGPSVNISLLGADGSTLVTESHSLGGSRFGNLFPDVEHEEEKPTESKPIELPADAILASKLTMFGPDESEPEDREKAKALYARPAQREPLSIVQGAALAAYADVENVSVAVCLPDSMISNGVGADTGSVRAMLDAACTWEVENGWLVGRPEDPVAAREDRISRGSLQAAVSDAAKNGSVTLDVLASFAAANKYGDANALVQFYGQSIAPGLAGLSLMGGGNTAWPLLRLYGTFDAELKMIAQRGGTVSVSRLSPNQRAMLNEMVFSEGAVLQRGQGVAASRKDFDFFEMMEQGMSIFGGGGGSTEPTEVFGQGISPRGQIHIGAFDESAFQAAEGDAEIMSQTMTLGLDELALYQMLGRATQGTAVSGDIPRLTKVKVGSRKLMQFVFQLHPDVYLEGSLTDDKFGSGAQTHTMSGLPMSIKQELDARREQMSKYEMLFKMMGAFGEGQGRQDPPLN